MYSFIYSQFIKGVVKAKEVRIVLDGVRTGDRQVIQRLEATLCVNLETQDLKITYSFFVLS